jgi:quercetin dioxygenase-like cupin family protein
MSEMPRAHSIDRAIDALTFLPDRTPTTSDDGAFARLAEYRDGAVFVGHWAGSSEWERHPVGDEIVMVIDGATTMTLIVDGGERTLPLAPGEFVVVPQGTWHRFDTPDGVKVLTVTPQPTDHQSDRPA